MEHGDAIGLLGGVVVLHPQKSTFGRQEGALPFFVRGGGEVFQDGAVLEDGGDDATGVMAIGFEVAECGVDVGVEDDGEHDQDGYD